MHWSALVSRTPAKMVEKSNQIIFSFSLSFFSKISFLIFDLFLPARWQVCCMAIGAQFAGRCTDIEGAHAGGIWKRQKQQWWYPFPCTERKMGSQAGYSGESRKVGRGTTKGAAFNIKIYINIYTKVVIFFFGFVSFAIPYIQTLTQRHNI